MLDPSKPFFVIADTHFFDDRVAEFFGRPKHIDVLAALYYDGFAPHDHSRFILKRWNESVGPDDQVLHLGDLCGWEGAAPTLFETEIAPRLNGRKYLILGNHDGIGVDFYERCGFRVIGEFGMRYEGREYTFGHYPRPHADFVEEQTHVHGHIHNRGYPVVDGPAGWRQGTTPTVPGQINVGVELLEYAPRLWDRIAVARP